ncbi:MAG: hypothetical protein MJK18_08605 [Bdellovibrionales bacterium]|nr:hypothetical protein [Bdellovibrionales bacterium]
MKKLNVLLPIFLLLLANCSLDIAIDDIAADDFADSSILSTSRGVGDGITSATVTLLLKNSNGTVVVDHIPDLAFINGDGQSFQDEGVTFVDCTKSNDEGISTCLIKSITIGKKRIGFMNLIVDLFGDIYFDPPERNGTFMQIVASAQVKQDADGYSVTSHTGAPLTGLRQEESGYTIFTSTTGSITPDE